DQRRGDLPAAIAGYERSLATGDLVDAYGRAAYRRASVAGTAVPQLAQPGWTPTRVRLGLELLDLYLARGDTAKAKRWYVQLLAWTAGSPRVAEQGPKVLGR